MRILLAAAFFLIGLGSTASQQVMKGEAKVTPLTSGGNPIGCSLEYIIILADGVYRNGGFVGLKGTYAWLAGEDRMGLVGMFKLGSVDFDRNMKPTRFKPASTTLRIGGKVHRPQTAIPCEDDSFVCGAYSTEGSLGVFSAMLNGAIEIGYNRRHGSFDVMVPLDVAIQYSMKLTDCMRDLMRTLIPAIEERQRRSSQSK